MHIHGGITLSSGKNRKRELAETAAVIVIGLIIIGASSLGVQFYLGTSTPLLAVESESMEPTLYRGDLVIVRRVDNPETLQVGDIIIFQVPWSDIPIVHRIVDIDHSGGEIQFTTKGDNNPSNDPYPVPEHNVLAKVIGSVRYLGFITLLLVLPGGFLFFVFLVVMYILVSIMCEGYTAFKAQQRARENTETS